MSQLTDITQEEFEVFLQEADEQIQLLDEDLVSLEKDASNTGILQEIFRAAHTLKGSSAMVGLDKMSSVAHAMETILDALRNDTLAISTSVIDALLSGLDVLKSLRQELASGEDSNMDINPVLAELEQVGKETDNAPVKKTDQPSAMDSETAGKLKTAVENGLNGYLIEIDIDPESPWKAVRCFQILDELSELGEILKSVPAQAEIDSGEGSSNLEVVLASSKPGEEINTALSNLAEIINIQVNLYNPDESSDITISIEKKASGKIQETQNDESTILNQKASTQKLTKASQTVRVDVKLLDSLMNLVGEMVIERNKIRQTSKVLETKYEGDEATLALRDTSANIMKLVNELQDNVLQARMLPISTVFNSFPRLVRDVAHKAGKDVDFIIEGKETELDRTIIEQIRDPLVHLLRNAVDHGIESAEGRLNVGKDEKGTVRLAAYQEQNHIIILVEDDGAGIDSEKVKEKAVTKGLITTEDASRLSDIEVINLIFLPGLSTAKQVTEVSGRGVGMDVVRTNIEALGGSVTAESKLGEGTRFVIRLPFTLATINGLLVSSADTVYIIPMTSLVEVLRLTMEQVESITRHEVIRVRDSILPLLRLDRTFGDINHEKENTDEILVVIVKSGEKSVGIVVDTVMDTQDIVVKSIGKYIGSVKGIAGATILGDGEVALILDTTTLVREFTGY